MVDVMEACQLCQGKIPLNETGRIMLASAEAGVIKTLHRTFRRAETELTDNDHLYVTYSAWYELQQHMKHIESTLPQEELAGLHGSLISAKGSAYIPGNEFPIHELREQVANPIYVKIIQEKLFQSYMQPIVETKNDTIFGYEFLLRPNSKLYPFNPAELFEFAQKAGMNSLLDSQARINAIRTGAHMLERGMKRFINFLPSSIYDPRHCLQSTFKAVKEYNVDADDLIFEVVETEKIEDYGHLEFIFDVYKQAGVMVALDDIGSGHATEEVLRKLNPNYAKIDRSLITDCHLDPEKLDRIKRIREIALELNITLLAEGIESAEEYKALKPFVDLAQGYYFGKPMLKPV